MDKQDYIGKRVKQVRYELPEFQHMVGREGTVYDAIVDEKGNVHILTEEDGVWCPARLCEVVPDARAGTPEAFQALVTRMAPVIREAAVLGFSEQDVMDAAKQAYFRVA